MLLIQAISNFFLYIFVFLFDNQDTSLEIEYSPGNIIIERFKKEYKKLYPAVVGGNVEISQRLTDTILKAFGTMGASQGTMNNVLFGNTNFGYYETLAGGTGAGDGYNGSDAVYHHMTNTRY